MTAQISEDGTRKWLLRTAPGIEFETVFIPEEDRGTLCVSSQVGCTLNCRFCHTGTQKLVRNLTPGEIVGQVMVARDALADWPSTRENRRITNVVMMGMGEPLYNFDNVKAALAIVADGDGLALSQRRITLSTAGVVPMIANAPAPRSARCWRFRCMRRTTRCATSSCRSTGNIPIAELMDACRNYPGLSNARRITFEYVMLKGVNDSLADARALVKLLAGIPAKINLIPFNPWPGAPYECSDWEQIEKFAEVVNRAGYASPVRTPRGRDIMAACGQLKSASIKERASARNGQVSPGTCMSESVRGRYFLDYLEVLAWSRCLIGVLQKGLLRCLIRFEFVRQMGVPKHGIWTSLNACRSRGSLGIRLYDALEKIASSASQNWSESIYVRRR